MAVYLLTNEKFCDKITTYTAEVSHSAYLAVYILPHRHRESKRDMCKKCKQLRVYHKSLATHIP